MGQPPSPDYDPLAFAVAEAHARGLELHAWVNPFRARHSSGTSPASPQHLSQARPELVRSYGKQSWLDPGEPAAREHSLRVLLDIVQRYDVDGLHMDDYFYPYKEKDAAGKAIEFPDATTYERYRRSGGKLSREDWPEYQSICGDPLLASQSRQTLGQGGHQPLWHLAQPCAAGNHRTRRL
jgi:uncharacterized lipoprotein YddW (UPF0748 family)